MLFRENIWKYFYNEYPRLIQYKSLLGSIFVYSSWGYTWSQYIADLNRNKINKPLVKIWSGR
jgi:hypothetical protein